MSDEWKNDDWKKSLPQLRQVGATPKGRSRIWRRLAKRYSSTWRSTKARKPIWRDKSIWNRLRNAWSKLAMK